MTVASTIMREDFVGPGAGPFPFPFYINGYTDLQVTSRDGNGIEYPLSYPHDFIATGAGSANGGTVTLTVALPDATWALSVQRNRPLTQLTDVRNASSFFPATYEAALDDLTFKLQQLQDQINRCVQVQRTIPTSTLNMTLPPPSPGAALVWNAAGTGLSNTTLSAAQLTAWNATHNQVLDVFLAGAGFTAGVTTQLVTSQPPGAAVNCFITFDIAGVVTPLQSDDFTLAGNTVTFAVPIPVGTTRVEIKYLYTYQVGAFNMLALTGDVTSAGTVTTINPSVSIPTPNINHATATDITFVAEADPANPPSGDLVLFAQTRAGAGSAAAPRVDDALNMPHWLQAAFMQSRRLVTMLLPTSGQPGATASTFPIIGNGMPGQAGVWNSTTGSTQQAFINSATWPYRPSLRLLGAAGVNIGNASTAQESGAYVGAGAGQGGFYMRTTVGCGGAVANMTGCMVGFYNNNFVVGSNLATLATLNGIYFIRTPGLNSGNWTISFDNGGARGANTDTTMPFTTLHIYELILYVPPNSSTLYWQVNDLTAGTSASGNIAMGANITTGTGITRDLRVQVLDTATVGLDWFGTLFEYDARVA